MIDALIEQQIITLLRTKAKADFIILFGSHAKGTARADSDIDLAYFSHDTMSPYDRFLLAGEIAALTNCEVDLVNIREIDTVLTMEIFAYGKPIDIQNENEYIRQKMRAYSMYATLNEQRAGIITAIKERGSVFGYE